MKHDKLTGIIALAILALTLAACGEVETGGPFILNNELSASYFELYNDGTEYRVVKGHNINARQSPCPLIVDIPATYNGKPVTEIAVAFSNEPYLIELTIPHGVRSISVGAFRSCPKLKSIIVDDNNPYYSSEGGILYDKEKTQLIQAPGGIANSATIPASVTSIGEDAFWGCTSLVSVTLPEGLTSIGKYAFRDCTNLLSVTLPEGLTSIGSSAFYDCTSLENVTIPASLTPINVQVFDNCPSIKSIDVDANNPDYSSEGGILYNKEKTQIVFVPKGISGAVVIPSGVTSIGNSALFSGCTSLTSVTIPASLTRIKDYEFNGCTSLTSVTFQGWISRTNFSSSSSFPGDLRAKYLEGGIGTYTRTGGGTTWTKQ